MTSRQPDHARSPLRPDLRLIADMVEPGTRVLDVGCGEGELLDHLWREKSVDARGIEISPAGVQAAVERGLSVVQGDANTDLADYPDRSFDTVILSRTLQAMRTPHEVLDHLVRIGRRAVVSFPNFGHWRVRAALAFGGRMPITPCLPDRWYDTPNIHLCTIADFRELAEGMGIAIERSIVLDVRRRPVKGSGSLANLFGEQAIFVLRRG